jgi:hypothetical protein
MTINIYPGDDDHYEDVDFEEPPEDPDEVAQMWRDIREQVEESDESPGSADCGCEGSGE